MGEIEFGFSVTARDEAGRFISALELAGEDLMRELADEGAKKAIEYAPASANNDPRTKHLKDSIIGRATGTKAIIEVLGARHWKFIEFGGGPSRIPGDVSFFWERYGRQWIPGTNVINHPPTGAKPYLRPAFHDLMDQWRAYAAKHYPS